jgi:hypothetical protein
MPESVEPTPERPQTETSSRTDAELTTASLAHAADGRTAADSMPSFANAETDAVERPEPLFADEETSRLRKDWDSVQASFVDEPRQAVEAADHLVASAIKRMAEMFADEKARLEGQWDRGGDVSTEDLRQALRRYRSFFGRVLSV